jgi:hypothetical protein
MFYIHWFFTVSLMFATACFAQSTVIHDSISKLSFTVEPAPEWTNLFKREHGWFGADGIFATPFDGKENRQLHRNSKNLIWFSDSMIGEVSDSAIKKAAMVHNSLAVLSGEKPVIDSIHFYWNTDSIHQPQTVFTPHTISAQPGDYYWLGDGFVNTEKGNSIYLFAYKMHNTDGGDDWSFKLTQTNLIVIAPDKKKPPYANSRQVAIPFLVNDSANDNASFGAGIFVNTKASGAPQPDGYIYVYGIRDKAKNLVVARVKPALFEDFDSWTFWNGVDWVSDIHQLRPIASGVSNELSVSALANGKYALVYQLNGMSPYVALQIGDSPIGPFGTVMKVYECPEVKEGKNYFTYNAKAHPSLSAAGELLISYNVNAFDFWKELRQNPTLYRPRFIKIKWK